MHVCVDIKAYSPTIVAIMFTIQLRAQNMKDETYHRGIPCALLTPLPLFEAMEVRARQRAERRKEIEELKRKKEEEKLVRD